MAPAKGNPFTKLLELFQSINRHIDRGDQADTVDLCLMKWSAGYESYSEIKWLAFEMLQDSLLLLLLGLATESLRKDS